MRNSMKKENVKGSLQCLKAMASAEFQGKTNRGVASRISSLSYLKKIDNGLRQKCKIFFIWLSPNRWKQSYYTQKKILKMCHIFNLQTVYMAMVLVIIR